MATLSSRLTPLTVSVPAASEWVSFTPTFNNVTLGTGSTTTGRWRRTGDSAEVQFYLVLGTGGSVTGVLGVQLPAGLNADTAKLAESNSVTMGTARTIDVSASTTYIVLARYVNIRTQIEFIANNDNPGEVDANSPFIWADGDRLGGSCTVPISGWTSHTASATSANAVVVGGQSVGSTMNFGATSNQGFNILANNVAAIASTAAGAVTLGSTSTSTSHVIQSTSNNGTTLLRNNTSASAGIGLDFKNTATNASTNFSTIYGYAGSARTLAFEFNAAGDGGTVGLIDKAGAWTLGPTTGTTATTHVLNNRSTTVGDYVIGVIKGANDTTTNNNFMYFGINNTAANSGRIAANGANTAAFQTTSDIRLKKNIQPLSGMLLKILSLKPCEFDYRDESFKDPHQTGFIAQEMRDVFPDSVGQDPDGMLTITGWDKTAARIVKAIQELHAELQELKGPPHERGEIDGV